MELVEEAARLYALPLDQFTGARNSTARKAAQDGNKELAATLRRLPKPASVAWLVNLLVRHRRDEVEQVLELGASLKEAQAGLDRAQLHALGQQRQRLLAAVARQSLDVAAELGHDVGPAALPGVEQTLRAALADPAAAAAVLTGRLVRTLEASGWDPVDLEGAVAGPFEPPAPDDDGGSDAAPAPTGSASKGDSPDEARTLQPAELARRRRRAEAALEAARDASAVAADTASDLHRRTERLSVRRDGLVASIEDLQERLDALRRELAEVEGQASDLEQQAAAADRALAEAEEEDEAARSALQSLEG